MQHGPDLLGLLGENCRRDEAKKHPTRNTRKILASGLDMGRRCYLAPPFAVKVYLHHVTPIKPHYFGGVISLPLKIINKYRLFLTNVA